MRCAAVLVLLAALVLGESCGRRPATNRPEVVLYSSVDDALLREVARAFEEESGIAVKLVGDTEATKTTGLVERLLAERARPRADVWWSSEPFGTIRLAREGVLEAYRSPVEEELGGSWPSGLRGALWYGFASRGRVIVYNTQRVKQPPRRIADLAGPEYRGRVGMARPQFGTTRGQMGYLLHACGEEGYRSLLKGLKESGVRLYDGNASVVRAVAQGEVDVGLTDTDDVWSGQRNGWPVELVFEEAGGGGCSPGPMLVPNTVALVKGAPHPEQARHLIDFVLSARVERMLAESDSHNTPVRPDLAREFARYAVPAPALPDFEAIAGPIPRALQIWDEVMGG